MPVTTVASTVAATVAPSAMPPPPSTGPRRPPVNKKGILSRRAVTIPPNQMAVLKNDTSWFSNIISGDESVLQSFRAVPVHVSKQLQKQHKQRATAAAAAAQATEAEAAEAEAAAAAAAAAAAENASSQAHPPQAPPTTATAPLKSATAGSVDLAGNAEEVSVQDPHLLEPAAAQHLPSAISPPSLRTQVSPPPARAKPPPTAPPAVTAVSPHKRVARLQTAAQADREVSEIPATPETQLQRQSLQSANVPPVPYAPSWTDVGGDKEVDKEETGAGDSMQQDEADQDGEGHMSQLQREQTATTAAMAATATTGRYPINRGLSPNLSSSPQDDDIEFQPVQALLLPSGQSSQAHAPISKLVSACAPHQTTAMPPQPLSNSSRAPSEDGTTGVRRRLMKAPVFPSSSKPLKATAQSCTATPDPAVYGTAYASRKCSSLVRLYTTAANKDSSSPPSTPGAGSAAEMPDANGIKRCNSVRSTVEKHIPEAVQKDVPAPPPVGTVGTVGTVGNSASVAPTPFAAAGSPAAAALTPAFKVRGPVYHTPAAHAFAVTPSAGSAVSTGQSPSMSPRHTWMLPYETFTLAYPDYTGDLEDFLRACYCLQSIAKARQLASYQFDDVVRSYLEYIEYVHSNACATPLNLHQWYVENTDELLYNKKVVTRSNVNAILMAYPDKVQSIQQLAEQGTEIAINAKNVKNAKYAENKQADKPASVALLSHALSFPAGRCFPVDEVHHRDSQDDSGPSNSLLNMSILGSSGESVWHHGQPSSPPGIHHAGGASQNQNQFLSQDASKDGSFLPGPGSVVRPDSQIQSSCLTTAENALLRSSPPVRTSALPPGMDRITYMLQSPPAMAWAMTDDENENENENEDAVAETPAKAKALAATRAKTTRTTETRLTPSAAAQTPISRKRSREWEDCDTQPPSSAAHPIMIEDDALSSTFLGHTVVHETIDDQESGDEHSGMDISLMSVQSAREVRQRSSAVKAKPIGESRRATIAASEIGMVARMAAAAEAEAEALALASHKGTTTTNTTTTPAPPAAKMTSTATANGPPKKKRKQTAVDKKAISRKALADFLAKKAQETGVADKPWLK